MEQEVIKQVNVYAFLDGGGEAAELIKNYDWSKTSLPAIEHWPLSLKITLGIILHSAFPMFLFWGDDLTCFYNDAYRPSLGNEGRHPSIGKNGKEVWPDVWEFIGPLIAGVLQTGKEVYFEDQLVPFFRNGQLEDIYWTFSHSPAFNDEGKIGGVLVTCIETTRSVLSRKQIEETVARRTEELHAANASMQQANEYLQSIINVFQEPLQVLEPVVENNNIVDFRYKVTNDIYAAYANTTPKEMEGKKVGEFFPGYFDTSSFINIADTYNTGKPHTWDLHYNVDGLSLHNKMSATKLGQDVVVHFTDFTEVKNLQLQLELKLEQLQRSNQQLEEFAYAASHDLKEPVRKVSIFIGQLKNHLEGQISEKEKVIFEKVENATSRMTALVDDLLRYSHISEGPVEKVSLDLKELVNHVLEDLELDIKEKKASLNIQGTLIVKGYKRQLLQLFQNLISNGLKYSKPNVPPRIDITSQIVEEGDGKYNLIEVKDNGIGFDQCYADNIFKMFVRLHGLGQYSGTGIGLSIVKKVVENHKGMIRVESVCNEGSIFKLYLPLD